MAWPRAILLVFGLCLFPWFSRAQDLVAGGGMTPYGGGGRRHGGYAQVRDPGKGFFVAGSTIDDLNGVYERAPAPPLAAAGGRDWALTYINVVSKWVMGLSIPPPDAPYAPFGGAKTEWLFVDPLGRERFGHKGGTVIPGSTTK